ncbi:hypothetical protein ACFPRL_08950 [Pseudoclavibacter helvolus]
MTWRTLPTSLAALTRSATASSARAYDEASSVFTNSTSGTLPGWPAPKAHLVRVDRACVHCGIAAALLRDRPARPPQSQASSTMSPAGSRPPERVSLRRPVSSSRPRNRSSWLTTSRAPR